MGNTYRDIYKWGDKRETRIDPGTMRVIREKFGLATSDAGPWRNEGDGPVQPGKACQIPSEVLSALADTVGHENISITDFDRASHAFGKYYTDLLYLRKELISDPPDAVIYPRSTADVESIIAVCNRHHIAVTPSGGRSSVTRGVESPLGGVSLDLTRHLNKILEINPTNSTATIQAGIYGPELEEHLNAAGFSCGHFPQSFEYSTPGGWLAAKGAGQASTGYGKFEHMVLALKVVTPAGTISTNCYPSCAQGWDIHPLFAGSEGTLGVIVEMTIKIRKHMPENTAHASLLFKDFSSAVEAMRESMQAGIGLPHLFRISDPEETEIAFKTKGFDGNLTDKFLHFLGYKTGSRCLMFVAVEGHRTHTRQVAGSIKRIAKRHGALSLGGNPTRKWLKQRYSSAYMRDPLMDLGIMTDTIETAVMWEDLIPLWEGVRSYLKKREKTVVMAHLSHVYENGSNLYFTFLSPMRKGNEMEEYLEYHRGLVDTIHACKGSLSHHHGVGRTLAPWLAEVLGQENMALMKAVKKHLDPNGIMNPGGTLALDNKGEGDPSHRP